MNTYKLVYRAAGEGIKELETIEADSFKSAKRITKEWFGKKVSFNKNATCSHMIVLVGETNTQHPKGWYMECEK